MRFPGVLNLLHQRREKCSKWGGTLLRQVQLHLGLVLLDISRYSLTQGFILREISSYTH